MTVMECLVPGRGQGVVMVLTAPLSFWGGVTADGVIADRRHPQRGGCVAERILVLPPSKGSSSSSSVLAELIRAGQGPVGLILPQPDPIIVVGVLAANELYAADVPVVRAAGLAIVDDELCALTADLNGHVAIRRLPPTGDQS